MHRSRRWTHLSMVVIVFALALSSFGVAGAATGTAPYVDLLKHSSASDFDGGTLSGVVVDDQAGSAHVHLASSNLLAGNNNKLYGQKSYWYGTLESPVFTADHGFDTLIPSWNAETPAGTWLQIEVRVSGPNDNLTKYYNLGIWASGTETIERQSVASQGDEDGFVATDTLLLNGDADYLNFQYRLTLFTTDQHASPSVSLVAIMTSSSYAEPNGLAILSDEEAWGDELNVPMRSQMIYKKGGEVWCSPTSTSMVLAYWGHHVTVPAAAAATYDYVYDGNGNWPFNTAWAGTYGLEAYVTRMGSMAQVEEWISLGVPVVISYAFPNGELDGTPIATSDGHLMVVRGFDENGDVIVNDPAAASDAEVRHVYDRDTLEDLWLNHSGGTVYLIYPKGHPVPTDNVYGSW